MPKTRNSPASRARRRKVLGKAKGYWGNKSRLYRYAKDAVERAEKFAYRDRRKKKTEMRQLWIVRINSICRANGINYSRFMNGLSLANVELDRKQLSEIAFNNPDAFKELIDTAKKALEKKAA
ncbi:MAG: 50S ribosomal protein L20 [Opitutales bacterium]|nr:50S ribosomal protein L20 [Opitutales bacterium]